MSKKQVIKTLKVRVKDKHAKVLRQMAREVNFVWNYCNDLSYRSIRERKTWLSGFDFSPYCTGASKEFEYIGSSTIQETCEEYAKKRKVAKRIKLNWRASGGAKRSLGWVPFKGRAAQWKNGQVKFAGISFGVWDSYGLSQYVFRAGCFTEDARGRWYFCITVKEDVVLGHGTDEIGIDLGLKTIATCSDGATLENGRWYERQQDALAKAQRARRLKRVKAIQAKTANRRKDALHKFTTSLVERSSKIVVGDVSSKKLAKTKMAKSVHNVGWYALKQMLEYKSRRADISFEVVNEAYTTRTCSECGTLSGPQGITALSVRSWNCECGAQHDRDINSAINILNLGAGHCAP